MTSSMLAGEKRWASSTRRGGMTVLGKVAVPKPLNLPSQRLENHGLDPSVEIVPKGTLSWGSRSSSSASNAWGSSALSPNTDGGTSSPSYLSGRPSSGGGTRPSTAGSDRMHEPTPNAWGQNSRPSSASGVLTSNQTALASRPCSAETRPGSSQLSWFAEPSSDNSVAWGPTGVSEKLNSSSMDYIDSVKVTREKVGMKFVSEINQTIKEHFENLLHVVDGLSARLSQLETHQLENAVDDLKVSAEYNSRRTDGKLRQLENILREVQDDIHFLRDRQEIAETQLQLVKLQVSKSNRQSEDQKTAPVQADSSLQALPSVSEQSSQPCPNAPSTILHQNAKPAGAPLAMDLHTQIAPNPIPSTPQPQSYYLPTGNILESTYQQYNVPPAQHEQPPPPVPSQLYQPASNLPQVSKSPEQAQLHPPLWTPPPPVPSQLYQPTSSLPQVSQSPELPQLHPPPWNPPPPVPSQRYQPTSSLPQVSQSPELPQLHPPPWTPPRPVPSQLYQPASNLPPVSQSPQTQPPWMAHHPEETPSMPSHNYQPPGGPSMQQFYMDSSQRMPEQPSRRPYSEFPADFSNMHLYSGSPSHYSRSTMKPSQFSPSSPPVRDGGNNYTQLPKAQILPHALPTASTVDAGSSSGRTGNKVSVDDVVDKVTAMGFRRDVARATVRKLTENGQTVDLNAVLDKLMNNDGDGQPHKGWSGR